jgi:CBS domain-containing protein
MTNNRVRHLPVMDGGTLAGLVSIGDVVKAMLDEAAHENRYLKEYMFGR